MDSTPAFNKALALGQPVWVPAGHYRLKSAVTLRSSGSNILEAMPGTAILFADEMNQGVAQASILLNGVSVYDVQVRGLIFDGNGASMPQPNSPHTRLVFIDGGTNVVFSDDVWRNSGGSALVFSGVHTPVIESGVQHSNFLNLGFAWGSPGGDLLAETAPVIVFANGSIQSNQHNFFSDNQISHVGSDAISVQKQSHFTADHNKLVLGMEGWKPNPHDARTYGVAGFYIFNGNEAVALQENEVQGATGNCFDLTQISGLQVTGNIASNCGGAGVSIGSTIDNFEITNNVLTYNYRSAYTPYPNVTHQGSVSFGCGREPCTTNDTISNGIVNGNIFTEAGKQAQPIDAWQQSTIILTAIQSDVAIVVEEQFRPMRGRQ